MTRLLGISMFRLLDAPIGLEVVVLLLLLYYILMCVGSINTMSGHKLLALFYYL